MTDSVSKLAQAHTTPHPASDGAHRLAWWLAARDEAGFEQLRDAGVSFALTDRLLSGEVEPEDDIAATIARETEGEVIPADWTRGGPLCWTDRPVFRPS